MRGPLGSEPRRFSAGRQMCRMLPPRECAPGTRARRLSLSRFSREFRAPQDRALEACAESHGVTMKGVARRVTRAGGDPGPWGPGGRGRKSRPEGGGDTAAPTRGRCRHRTPWRAPLPRGPRSSMLVVPMHVLAAGSAPHSTALWPRSGDRPRRRSMEAALALALGAAHVTGGVVGYLRKNSKPSLAGGLFAGSGVSAERRPSRPHSPRGVHDNVNDPTKSVAAFAVPYGVEDAERWIHKRHVGSVLRGACSGEPAPCGRVWGSPADHMGQPGGPLSRN